jgi:hypothetical protein
MLTFWGTVLTESPPFRVGHRHRAKGGDEFDAHDTHDAASRGKGNYVQGYMGETNDWSGDIAEDLIPADGNGPSTTISRSLQSRLKLARLASIGI